MTVVETRLQSFEEAQREQKRLTEEGFRENRAQNNEILGRLSGLQSTVDQNKGVAAATKVFIGIVGGTLGTIIGWIHWGAH